MSAASTSKRPSIGATDLYLLFLTHPGCSPVRVGLSSPSIYRLS